MAEDNTVLYDVCNDYSLKPANIDEPVGHYDMVDTPNGITYVHSQYDEIHYFRGPVGLTGANYFDVR